VWRSGGLTHYFARVGGYEIEGSINKYAYRDDIKAMLNKAIEGQGPLYDKTLMAIESVVNHLVTVIRLGATSAAASAGFDCGPDMGITFVVEMTYGDDG